MNSSPVQQNISQEFEPSSDEVPTIRLQIFPQYRNNPEDAVQSGIEGSQGLVEQLAIEGAISFLRSFYFRCTYDGVITSAEAITTVTTFRPRVRKWMEQFARSLIESPSCVRNGSWIGSPPTLECEFRFREKGLRTVYLTQQNVHDILVEALVNDDKPSSYALVSSALFHERQCWENRQWAEIQKKTKMLI